MVSSRTLLVLVLVSMLVASEAAPQFGGRRFVRRRRPGLLGGIVNGVGRFLGGFGRRGGGRLNSQANANVLQAGPVTQVNANVVTTQQNNPGGVSLSGGLAVASNLRLNSPFGSLNLANTQAQTINQAQSLPFFG